MITITYDASGDVSTIAEAIAYSTDKKTIQELWDMWEKGRLELSPAFQRQSVWTTKQRQALIKSIYENVPLPSVFLCERYDDGRLVYDVIDGKQRLESILMFLRAKRFKTKGITFQAEWFEDGERCSQETCWTDLYPQERQKILRYSIDTITVKADLAAIAEIFVRINSTGSSLKKQEIRTAKFLNSAFLKRCRKVAESKSVLEFLVSNKVVNKRQLLRLKHIEVVGELILSINNRGPLNKKKAIDDAMKAGTLTPKQINHSAQMFKQTLSTIGRLFPKLRETRFVRVSDFYTLFMLVWHWKYEDKYVLTNASRNALAQAYLLAFAHGVDMVSEKQRKLKPVSDDERLFADYLLSVREGTDRLDQRQRRESILNKVFEGCFDAKDPYRLFSKAQRRIVWFESDKHCSLCKKRLRVGRFQIDHVKPHSKGGKTKLSNAQILCPSCNKTKSDKV